MPNLLAALKHCYLSSVATKTYPGLQDQRNRESRNTETIWISASHFMQVVKEIRSAAALKHDIISLLVDSSSSAQQSSLVCVEALQERLRRSVLLPYLDTKISQRNSAHDLGGCSGQLSPFPPCSPSTSLQPSIHCK